MPRDRFLPPLRVTKVEERKIKARANGLSFPSLSEYLRALIREDIPELDPANNIKKKR